MRPQTKLHPETIAIRQMLATVLVSFVLGFVGVLLGIVCLRLASARDPIRWWQFAEAMLHSLEPAFLGGLGLCALCCTVLSRWHFKRGYHRCPYCNRVLEGIGKWCSCPEVQALKRDADAAAKRPVA